MLSERLDQVRTGKSSWRLPVLRYCSVPESSLATAARGAVPACRLGDQLAYLRRRGWRLLGLSDALDHVYTGGPDRVLALTFDGGLLDFLNAWRVLSDIGAGATLYVPLGSVGLRVSRWDRGFSRLGWEELEDLAKEGVELGVQLMGRQNLKNWRVVSDLAMAKGRLQSRLRPERVSSFCLNTKRRRVSSDVRRALTQAGYDTACTLRRGVTLSGGDAFSIPRISVTMQASGEAVHELLRRPVAATTRI